MPPSYPQFMALKLWYKTAAVLVFGGLLLALQLNKAVPGISGEPYLGMPLIAPIGARIATYLDVAKSAKGPDVDPAKGYRLQDLGQGFYMVTDNACQSMFLVYEHGVVVVDAPPS